MAERLRGGGLLFLLWLVGLAFSDSHRIHNAMQLRLGTLAHWVYEATNSMMLVVEWLNRSREHGFTIDAVKPRWLRWLIYYAICMGIILFSQQSETFIYFQF